LFRFPSDRLIFFWLYAMAGLAGSILLLVLVFLFYESWPFFAKHGLGALVLDSGWHPSSGRFNLSPMLVGTLAVTLGAVSLAVPLGLGTAIYCHYYAPLALAGPLRRMVELMGGMPSVVFGLWGLMVLVPWIGSFRPPGASLLAGVLILALMILPTITLTSDAALSSVPASSLHAAAALGLSRWAILKGVVLPSARSGVVAGVILAFGRAVGETMAVMMVCGNQVQVPNSIFEPVRTLTANIALEMAYAVGDHRSALFVSGLLLVGMVMVLIAIAHWVSKDRLHG